MTSAKLRRLGRFALAASFALARPGGKRFRRVGFPQSLVAQNRRADRLGGFLQQRHRRVQDDPPRRRHRPRAVPERSVQDHDPGRAGRLRSARHLLQLVRRGRRAACPRRAGARHHRARQGGRRFREHAFARLAVVIPCSMESTTASPTDAVSKYFYYNKKFFAEHNLQPPADFDGLLGLCQAIRKIDPNIVPMPLGNSERWKLNHYITMLNQRVLGAEGTAADYSLSNDAGQALHRSRLRRRPGRKCSIMKNAGCWQDAPNATSPEFDALDVLLRAVADDLLRHLVRRHLRRRRLHRLRHVPHAGGQGGKGDAERQLPGAGRLHDLGQDQAPEGSCRLG